MKKAVGPKFEVHIFRNDSQIAKQRKIMRNMVSFFIIKDGRQFYVNDDRDALSKQKAFKTVNGVFICGRIALCPGHAQIPFSMMDKDDILVVCSVVSQYKWYIPKEALLFKDYKDRNGNKVDACLIGFNDRSMKQHDNIVKHFVKDLESIKNNVPGLMLGAEIFDDSIKNEDKLNLAQTAHLNNIMIEEGLDTRIKGLYTYKGKTTEYVVRITDKLSYQAKSLPGYCGSLILVDVPEAEYIIEGIHTAADIYSQDCHGVAITQEGLKQLIDTFPKELHIFSDHSIMATEPIDPRDTDLEDFPNTNFLHIGRIPSQRIPSKNKIVLTEFGEAKIFGDPLKKTCCSWNP